MKRIDELSKSEVLALTSEEIAKLIDLECAVVGVPFLPPEPKKPEVKKFEPDITVYGISGFYFKTPEEAAKILEVFQQATPYNISWGDNILKPLSDYEKVRVESRKAMSPEYYDKVKSEKSEADAATKEYETRKKEYDAAVVSRQKQVDYVWDIVNAARDEQYKRDCYKAEFARYLVLADNNKEIALNFLKNAHSDVSELEGFEDELLA